MNDSFESSGLEYRRFTLFQGHRHLASGTIGDVALPYKRAISGGYAQVLLFDNSTGRTIDLEIRGNDEEVVDWAIEQFPAPNATHEMSGNHGPGRPKLGVVAREVTLLPRHWEWLASQRGGASVTLRRLVEEARKATGGQPDQRKARERAYYFMSAIAGDLENFEEASRALFAGDKSKLLELIANWPEDVREHLNRSVSG